MNNLLKILRGQRSQSDMAEIYGVSQQGWQSWEIGRTTPSNQIMLQMERDFSIPMEIIFFDSFNYKNTLKSKEITTSRK